MTAIVPTQPEGREGEMPLDTLIFLLIFLTLLAMRGRHRGLVLTCYFVSLAATVLLFWLHLSDTLKLNF